MPPFRHAQLNLEAPIDAIEEDLRDVASYLIERHRCYDAELAVIAYRGPRSRPAVAWQRLEHALRRAGVRLGAKLEPEIDAALRRLAVCLHPDLGVSA